MTKQMKHTIDDDKAWEKEVLLAAMVYGVDFKVEHGITAFYTHSYYILSDLVKDGYWPKSVTSVKDWSDTLPEKLVDYLAKNHPDYDYEDLIRRVSDAVGAYHTDEGAPEMRVFDGYREVSSEQSVDILYNHKYGGDYSTMTTISQSDLTRELLLVKMTILNGEDTLREVMTEHAWHIYEQILIVLSWCRG